MSAENDTAKRRRHYRDLDALIARVARQLHGAARTGTPAPLSLIRAAATVAASARLAKKEAIQAARGAGDSWDAIADALGFPEEPGWPPAAVRAFEEIAGRPSAYVQLRQLVIWTCTTCGNRVEESSPPGSDPSVAEQGHTDDCARHRAAVADYAQAARSGAR